MVESLVRLWGLGRLWGLVRLWGLGTLCLGRRSGATRTTEVCNRDPTVVTASVGRTSCSYTADLDHIARVRVAASALTGFATDFANTVIVATSKHKGGLKDGRSSEQEEHNGGRRTVGN